MQRVNDTAIRGSAIKFLCLILVIMIGQGCINNHQDNKSDVGPIHLIVLAPGHFHAALLQKSMYAEVDSTVNVYAPEGPEVKSYLSLIDKYNSRAEDPTGWEEKVYTGPGYLEKMLTEMPGNLSDGQSGVVVVAGNNRMKTSYIKKSVDAGLNVLADKPMAITKEGFEELKNAFEESKKNKVLLYDIMTERYEITNMLQKAFSEMPEVFGKLKAGTPDNPAVISESVHYFYKEVSGAPLVRPDWYFDVKQEGEGIVDVTTHLVDLIQWECFPGEVIDYQKDIRMLSARHWPTVLTPSQFRQVTGKETYPDFLKNDIKDSLLNVYANGEMNYTIKGIHAKVSVAWKFQAPKGTGDTFYSMLQGTKANLVLRQGKEQHYKPVLYIEPVQRNQDNWKKALENGLDNILKDYPGLSLRETDAGWEVVIPEKYKIGHEQHFALVIKKYIQYLQEGKMPEWETAAMIAKYYTTTSALEMAVKQ